MNLKKSSECISTWTNVSFYSIAISEKCFFVSVRSSFLPSVRPFVHPSVRPSAWPLSMSVRMSLCPPRKHLVFHSSFAFCIQWHGRLQCGWYSFVGLFALGYWNVSGCRTTIPRGSQGNHFAPGKETHQLSEQSGGRPSLVGNGLLERIIETACPTLCCKISKHV